MFAGVGAMVAAKASPLPAARTGGWRGSPAGGVGVTPVTGCAPPSPPSADGPEGAVEIGAAGAPVIGPDGTAAAGEGACTGVTAGVGERGAAAPGCCERRWPQCWQKAKPTGVPLPHAGQIALGAEAAGDAASAASAITVADTGEAGLGASEAPHILQKFMPGGFCVPQALQTVPLDGAGAAAFTGAAAGTACGAPTGSRRWPQSWQNSDPSRLTFPQWVQRGIAYVTSGV
jgi:hypothetical protein